jgi:O-antigen/teichoic acid export membrane protein
MRRLHGFAIVVAGTAVAGVAGYLITWWVARQIGLGEYREFAVFWAFVYLLIGALSGIQQEVTRATRPHPSTAPAVPHARTVRNFAITAAIVVAAVVCATSPLWVGRVFPTEGYALVWPLAVAASSWVFFSVVAGSLYGTSQWTPLASIIVLDPVLRLLALVVALMFSHDLVLVAWMVAFPVPATLILLSPLLRRRLATVPDPDVGYGQLAWNVTRTVLAAAALSLIVSGFPLVLGVTTHGQSSALGLLILAITLTRAPLIVTVMSLQSFLIVRFRDHSSTMWRTFLSIQGVLVAAAAILAALGWWLGPSVFGLLFPHDPRPAGWLLAVLVGSSALVAALCVSAAAVLARAEHLVYSLGWVVAAVVTVVALLTPFDLISRTVLALVAGPLAGLIVHAIGLISLRGAVAEPEADPPIILG